MPRRFGRRGYHGRILVLLVVPLALILIFGGLSGVGYWRYRAVATFVKEGRDHLDKGQKLIKAISIQKPDVGSLRDAREEFTLAEEDFRNAQLEIAPFDPLLGLAKGLPSPGPEMEALSNLLAIARDVAVAGRFTTVGLEPTFALVSGDSQTPTSLTNMPRAVVDALKAGQSDFVDAENYADKAAAERAQIVKINREAPFGSTIAGALSQIDEELPRLQSTLHSATSLPDLLDSFLGIGSPKTYLILGQNNFELRASGGFIGSMGLVNLDQGQIAQMDYRSSYAFDNLDRPTVVPPAPLQKYMDIQNWFIRDSNWWPDFPSSAQQAEWFFSLDQGKKVDGVIAIDLIGVRQLLQVLGPVNIESYDTTVDSDNMLDKMWYYIYSPEWKSPEQTSLNEDPGQKGKAFLTYLFQAVVEKAGKTDLSHAPALMQALQKALDEKHILLYFHDPSLTALAAERNWDGAVSRPANDFLFVADTNVSYSEVNAFVDQQIKYEVVLGQDLAVDHSRVTITYSNKFDKEATKSSFERFGGITFRYATGKVENVKGSYGDYVRLYVPKGSRLIGAQGFETSTETWDEQGRTVFANYISLLPGETKQVVVDYVPPVAATSSGDSWHYQLTALKQPGTVGNKLSVVVKMPGTVALVGTDPKMVSTSNSASLETTLSSDRQVELVLRR